MAISLLIPLLIVLLCFVFTLAVIERIKRENLQEKLYRVINGHDRVIAKDKFLTENEIRFFRNLNSKFGEKYYIFTQVSLSALIQIEDDQLDRYERRETLNKFFVDFVICLKSTLKPILIVELNDKSHFMKNKIERDNFISGLIESANMKFYSCPPDFMNNEQFMKDIEQKLLIDT